MLIDFFIFLGISLLFTTWMFFYYKGVDVKIEVAITCFIICFTMMFSLFLCTIDIYNTNNIDDRDNEVIYPFWLSAYWIFYILSYLFIPFFKSYEAANGFFFKEKAWKSIKENLIWYGIYILFALGLVLYLIISNTLQLDNLVAALTSIGNAFGVMIIIMLNGYGLVELPKDLFYNILLKRTIEQLCFRASIIEEEKHDNTDKLKDLEKVSYIDIMYRKLLP